MSTASEATPFWSPAAAADDALFAAPKAQLARVRRIVAHRSFRLAARAAHGCLDAEAPNEVQCLGGAFAVSLRPTRQPPSPGWLRLTLQVEGPDDALANLAIEGRGVDLPPHSRHAALQRSGTAFSVDYYLAPGTTSLLLAGTAQGGQMVFVRDVNAREQGSHEARAHAGLARIVAHFQDHKAVRHDVRVLRECYAQRDWRRVTRALRRRGLAQVGTTGYRAWLAEHDALTPDDVARMRARAAAMAAPPQFSIVVPCYNTPPELLQACIDSVRRQIYPHWQLCLSNDASTEPHVKPQLDAAAASDPRIKVVHCAQNGHISRASNAAIGLAEHPWLVLLDHDDVLAPHALQLVAQAIEENPDAGLVYSDEDKLDLQGQRCDPYFKPAYNPDLLRAQNYISHLGVYRKDLVDAVGGFRSAFNGSQDYDLVLRVTERLAPHQIVHVPHVLYHWRMTPGSAALGVESKPYAYIAAELALAEHLQRTGRNAKVRPSIYHGQYHTKYALPPTPPKISIIVPSRDNVDVLDRCLETLRATTHYPNYEVVVVDNDSHQPRTLRYLKDLGRRPGVRVLPYPHPFNYAAINNWAVAQTDGELVCLLNDDVEILHADWLEELAAQALRPEIGAVGAKLLYPNQTIQHGGVVLGIGGIAAHAFKGLGATNPGYFARPVLASNIMAVTGACLVVRRALYQAVGGMNEKLAVAYNDVDLCIRLYRAGYDNVWTPHAVLVHHESVTRGKDKLAPQGRFADEWRWMARAYRDEIACDPYYSPNLTVDREDYGIAEPPRHKERYALRPKLARATRPQDNAAATRARPPAGISLTDDAAHPERAARKAAHRATRANGVPHHVL